MGISCHRPVRWTSEEGGKDICSVITVCSDFGIIPGGGVTIKGTQPR